jgi:N4-gp56 family major capsid protein
MLVSRNSRNAQCVHNVSTVRVATHIIKNGNMAATSLNTTTEIPQAVNYFYDRVMLQAARPLLLHTKWAQVKDIPKGNGTAIKFRRYALLSVNTTALTEGVTPTGKQLSYSDVYPTVEQYGDFITLSDKLVLTTLDPVLTETADKLGQQAGNSLDTICREVLVAGTTEQFASTATSRATITASMKLTRDEIRQAVRTLQNNDASPMTSYIGGSSGFNTTPIMAAYVAIISPSTYYDLKNESGFVPVSQYPSQNGIMPGEVGSMDEVRFVMSTKAKVWSAVGVGSIDVHSTLIMAKDFYGISRIAGAAMENIVHPLGSAGSADPLNQRQTSGWKATFVAVILNENYACRIDHAVSA